MKPSRYKQCSIFSLCPLAAPGHHEHIQIHELVKERLIAERYDRFDDAQPAVRPHRAVAVLENRNAAFIVRIVNDPLENVGVASLWDLFKKVASHKVTSCVESMLPNMPFAEFDDVR